VVSPAAALALRTATRRVHVGEELLDYLWRLADAVRSSPHLELGVSPRGALALLEAARAAALLDGRDYVIPDVLKRYLAASWSHRVILGAESELEGQSATAILTRAADTVEVPHVRSGS
jgi:MoxR-like ATPase